MKKKILAIVVLICVIVTLLVACGGNAEIKNNSFDVFKKGDNKTLTDWKTYQDKNDKSVKKMKFDELQAGGSDEGGGLVTGKFVEFEITNNYGTIGLKQDIELKKDVSYVLQYSMNISTRVSVKSDGFGAFVGFEQDLDFLDASSKDKTEGWKQKKVYFTVEDSGRYTLMVGLGREETGGARGKVAFDNITITQIDSIPTGITAATVTGTNDYTRGGTIAYVVLFALATIAIGLFAYILILRSRYKRNLGIPAKSKWLSPFMSFMYILSGAFIIRFLIVAFTGGIGSEMAELGNVALKIADKGITNIFGNSPTTQPTGVLYLLSLAGVIGSAAELSASSIGMSILIRLPMLIADLVVCYLLFYAVTKFRAQKEGVSQESAQQEGVIAAGLYGMLPITFTLSAVWGRYMSVALAFVLAMLIFMIDKKYIGVSAMYLCALMFNHWMLILAPFVVLYMIYFAVVDKRLSARLSIVGASLAAVVLFWVLALPFTIDYVGGGNFLFVFKKMFAAFETNALMSNDTFNLYAAFGLGRSAASVATQVITGIIMSAFLGVGIWAYLKTRNRIDLILLAAMSLILFTVFGLGAQIEIMVIGIMLLMLYAIIRNDKRVMRSFNIMGVLSFINIGAIVIRSSAFTKGNEYVAFAANDWLYILGSILMLFSTLYMCWVTFSIMFNDSTREFRPVESIKGYFLDVADDVSILLTKKK